MTIAVKDSMTGQIHYFPDDATEDEINAMLPPMQQSTSSQPAESFGMSLLKAPGRIKEDVINTGKQLAPRAPELLEGISNYFSKARTEVPGLGNLLMNNPIAAGKQGIAGLAEMGHDILNKPSDIAQYEAQRLHLLPQSIANAIPKQRDITGDINELLGKPTLPGEALARGLARNSLNIGMAAEPLLEFNPSKLTTNSLIKDVLKEKKNMINKYSGSEGLFEGLKKEASDKGLTMSNFDPKNIDIEAIEKYTHPKYTEALHSLVEDPNISSAQKAISDLGIVERSLDKPNLLLHEQEQLRAVKNAKNYIQQEMFKDKFGNIDQDLLDKHKAIQKGYAIENVPYTTDKYIKEYEKDKLLKGALLKHLMNPEGSFIAQRGHAHPALKIRSMLPSNPYLQAGLAGGAGSALIASLISYFRNNKQGNQ